MPTKKDLAALLSETPQQPLRRGRGLRLSRASKQARELAAKPSAAPEPSTVPEPAAMAALPSVELADVVAAPAPTIAPDAVAAEADARVIAATESAALSESAPLTPERDKRKLLLRKDLLKRR